jgi:hypothetical protein
MTAATLSTWAVLKHVRVSRVLCIESQEGYNPYIFANHVSLACAVHWKSGRVQSLYFCQSCQPCVCCALKVRKGTILVFLPIMPCVCCKLKVKGCIIVSFAGHVSITYALNWSWRGRNHIAATEKTWKVLNFLWNDTHPHTFTHIHTHPHIHAYQVEVHAWSSPAEPPEWNVGMGATRRQGRPSLYVCVCVYVCVQCLHLTVGYCQI